MHLYYKYKKAGNIGVDLLQVNVQNQILAIEFASREAYKFLKSIFVIHRVLEHMQQGYFCVYVLPCSSSKYTSNERQPIFSSLLDCELMPWMIFSTDLSQVKRQKKKEKKKRKEKRKQKKDSRMTYRFVG